MKLLSKFFILGFVFFISSAQAQDIIGIQEQIDSMKEEIVILQRKVYRDSTELANPLQSEDYNQIVRSLNGKVDELEYKLKSLEEKLDTINKDIDVRFRLLEGKPIPAGQSSVTTSKKFDTIVAKGAPKSIVGDAIVTSDLKNLQPEKNMSVDELYTTGLEALKLGDAEKAEKYFAIILKEHETNKLSGNAQYWLGEVYYKNKQFDKAAVAFAKGYNNYKEGAKGADSLLKLGLSMAQIGKKDEACLAFVNLPTEFKKADDTIKAKAKNEAKKLGCK